MLATFLVVEQHRDALEAAIDYYRSTNEEEHRSNVGLSNLVIKQSFHQVVNPFL